MSMSQVIPSPCAVSPSPAEGWGIGSDQGAVAAPRETLGERRDREPKRRAMLAVALVELLGLVKVVLGAVVYSNIWKIYLAISRVNYERCASGSPARRPDAVTLAHVPSDGGTCQLPRP